MPLAEVTVSTAFYVIALLAIVIEAIVIYVGLFVRGPRYKMGHPDTAAVESDEFASVLEALTDSKIHRQCDLHVFTNGDQFYTAELEAIRGARSSVHLEAYIFQKGEIARQYIAALAARARAGVRVRMVIDALGSATTTDSDLREVTDAGGQLAWYHPFSIPKLPSYNNRTHRELLIVDGNVAFVGGAGVADHWYKAQGKHARWRDTMVRVHGAAVCSLQAVFAENWLESRGELLTASEYFPMENASTNETCVMVVQSTPSGGGSTRARTLMQMLIAAAQSSIHITTPYFLPDSSMRDELNRARKRGVDVRIVVPGTHSDHLLTRSSSRRAYGKLLQVGVRIFEFQPAMIHAKVLIVDGTWSVVGSTNFDNRSFGLNDEVNLAVRDRQFASRLEQDFARDLANSHEVTLQEWTRRPIVERVPEVLGWVLERQE